MTDSTAIAGTASPPAESRLWSAAQALVAVLMCCVVVYSCARYGPAIDNDTADFFSAADSVVAGQGLIMTTGRLFILWPPLHPLLLAALGFAGIDHSSASLLINLAALCVTLWVGARLITRLSGSPALGLLFGLVVALAPDMYWIHTRALSEALFVAFCTLALAGCCAYLETPRPRYFALMVIGAGLAWVERYAGMVLLPVLGACLLFAPGPERLLVRVRRSVVFGVLAGLPMLPWVIRNLIHTRQFTGDRGSFGEFGMPVPEALSQSTRTVVAWFVPQAGALQAGLVLAAIAVTVAGCLLAVLGRERGRTEADAVLASKSGWVRLLPLIGFPVVYFVFTDVININYEIDGLGPRQMLPALPAVWTLALLAGHRAFLAWRSRARLWSLPAGLVLLGMLGSYFSVTGPAALDRARQLHRDGAGFYSTERWRESPILAHVPEMTVEAELYSNDVYALYLFGGLRSSPLPPRPWRYRLLAQRLQEEGQSIQAFWIFTNERNRLPAERMQEYVEITPLIELADGAVYRIDPR